MKIWKQLLALLLSGAMALSLFACGSGDAGPSASPDASGSPDPAASADPEASATPAIVADLSQGALEFSAGMKPDDVLLTVNGIEIPADLFLYLLGMNCVNIQSYLPLFNMTLEDVADSLLEETVSLASYHALLRQKAGELGCLPTDAQNEEIDKTMEESDLDTTAAYWQLSDGSARYIVAMNTYYNNVLEAATQAPTEEELNDYIAAHEIYRVKHILLKTVDDNRDPLPDDQVAEKKAQAEDLLAQLQGAEDLPAKFDELMMAHSEDNPQNNPDGYLSKPGDMVAAFESASLALEEGGLSGIVETEYGYHIILRLPLTDEDRAQCESQYRPGVLEDLMDQWSESADVVRSEALNGLDVAGFCNRLAAYQAAMSEQLAPAESAPVESGGVG